MGEWRLLAIGAAALMGLIGCGGCPNGGSPKTVNVSAAQACDALIADLDAGNATLTTLTSSPDLFETADGASLAKFDFINGESSCTPLCGAGYETCAVDDIFVRAFIAAQPASVTDAGVSMGDSGDASSRGATDGGIALACPTVSATSMMVQCGHACP